MTQSTEKKFNPEGYFNQLQRCDLQSKAHLASALDADLSCQELTELIKYLDCTASTVVDVLSKKLGL